MVTNQPRIQKQKQAKEIVSTTVIRSHSTQGTQGWNDLQYLCPFLTLFNRAKKTWRRASNQTWYVPSSPPSLYPSSAAGNKSCCNYQAGSISHIAPLPHLQLTLTCSSLSASHCYRSVTDRWHPVSSLHTSNVHAKQGCTSEHGDESIQTHTNRHEHGSSQPRESWMPWGHRSQLLLETSQLSNPQRVTRISENSSLSPLWHKEQLHWASYVHLMWT